MRTRKIACIKRQLIRKTHKFHSNRNLSLKLRFFPKKFSAHLAWQTGFVVNFVSSVICLIIASPSILQRKGFHDGPIQPRQPLRVPRSTSNRNAWFTRRSPGSAIGQSCVPSRRRHAGRTHAFERDSARRGHGSWNEPGERCRIRTVPNCHDGQRSGKFTEPPVQIRSKLADRHGAWLR